MSLKCVNGEECMINKYGIARCECPSECEPVVRPVCGKDSKTYDNECELRKASCLSKKNIEVAYTGVCGKSPLAGHLGRGSSDVPLLPKAATDRAAPIRAPTERSASSEEGRRSASVRYVRRSSIRSAVPTASPTETNANFAWRLVSTEGTSPFSTPDFAVSNVPNDQADFLVPSIPRPFLTRIHFLRETDATRTYFRRWL